MARLLVVPDQLLTGTPAVLPTEPRARQVAVRAHQLDRLYQKSAALKACTVEYFAALGVFYVEGFLDLDLLSTDWGVKSDPKWLAEVAGGAIQPAEMTRDKSLPPGWHRLPDWRSKVSWMKSLSAFLGLTSGSTHLTGAGVRVGVIEYGVSDHLHVAQRVVNKAKILDNQIVAGEQFSDSTGHGTHVAGLVVGPSGEAPDADLILATINASTATLTYLALIRALNWLAETRHVAGEDVGCDVVNVCVYVSGQEKNIEPIFSRLLTDFGTLVVVAAGNSNTLNLAAYFDACITVGATDDQGTKQNYASGTSYTGVVKPEIYAKGIAIESCLPDSLGGHGQMKGTSQATPQVSAAAALLLQQTPSLRRNGEGFRDAVLGLRDSNGALDLSRI